MCRRITDEDLAEREDAIKNRTIVLAHKSNVMLFHAVGHLVHVVGRDFQQEVDVLLGVELFHLLPQQRQQTWSQSTHIPAYTDKTRPRGRSPEEACLAIGARRHARSGGRRAACLVRGLVRLVAHHLLVKLIAQNELVCQLHAVRLHGVRWPIIVLSDLRIMEVRHAVLGNRTRHGGQRKEPSNRPCAMPAAAKTARSR